MKILLILRHAKTEAYSEGGDRSRALTDRGIRDAGLIGRHVLGVLGCPDVIVTSDAVRAVQTTDLFAKAADCTDRILTEPAIYDADVETLLGVVQSLPDRADYAVIVGHNPGFEELASVLTGQTMPPVHMPTAAAAHLEFDIPSWTQITPGSGRLVALYEPKNLPH